MIITHRLYGPMHPPAAPRPPTSRAGCWSVFLLVVAGLGWIFSDVVFAHLRASRVQVYLSADQVPAPVTVHDGFVACLKNTPCASPESVAFFSPVAHADWHVSYGKEQGITRRAVFYEDHKIASSWPQFVRADNLPFYPKTIWTFVENCTVEGAATQRGGLGSLSMLDLSAPCNDLHHVLCVCA